MSKTLEDDRNANINKKPAFKRFKLLSKIDNTLRKINVQDEFLHKDGCKHLYNWLVKMPDETFPNQKIVHVILQCIDRLPIGTEYPQDCDDLEQALEVYKAGAGPGYHECQDLAGNILNKWYREKNDIKTSYDKEGLYDDGWKKLQKQLNKERKPELRDEDSDDDVNSQIIKKQKLEKIQGGISSVH